MSMTTVKIEATDEWINSRIADAQLVLDAALAAETAAHDVAEHAEGYNVQSVEDRQFVTAAAQRIFAMIESFRVSGPDDK